ncbi:hypothetical protein IPZ61_01730 [Streptomyces sioyaensis]|uniref:hypothetical protein n=1 Tax=Streptomyces sioyaensis TaxID=67364 RepID=UPI001F1D57C6|nr:hypothetical protein [Streptomyces sioyaensis]MCF3172060.1 hypothetical protein [Streptomyces sioyaensis]
MALLYLDTLKCVTSEDWTGQDEPAIHLGDHGVVKTLQVEEGGEYTVDVTVHFKESIGVLLIEKDDPDPNDNLGLQVITDKKGNRSATFKRYGAHYELSYSVE